MNEIIKISPKPRLNNNNFKIANYEFLFLVVSNIIGEAINNEE
mgnify:CR=1 FL=1